MNWSINQIKCKTLCIFEQKSSFEVKPSIQYTGWSLLQYTPLESRKPYEIQFPFEDKFLFFKKKLSISHYRYKPKSECCNFLKMVISQKHVVLEKPNLAKVHDLPPSISWQLRKNCVFHILLAVSCLFYYYGRHIGFIYVTLSCRLYNIFS